MARFYAFVKEQESITFPEKPLDSGGRPATEKEEGVRYKQMHMKSAFDDGSQRIDPEAEICVASLSQYLDKLAYPHYIFILIFFEYSGFSHFPAQKMRITYFMR